MAGRASTPARLNIERIMAERVALHHHIPPPDENIPIFVDPFLLDDLVPMEDDIKWAVWRLRDNRSRGPSRMRTEQLQQWIWKPQMANEAVASVTESGLTKEVDVETLKEAET